MTLSHRSVSLGVRYAGLLTILGSRDNPCRPDAGALAECDSRHSDLRLDVLVIACPKHIVCLEASHWHGPSPATQCWRRIGVTSP
jgi:hypothetical protein